MILYRLLRPDENPAKGLMAKDPYSIVTVNDHVSFGSDGTCSKYISCSKTREGINKFAYHSTTFPKRIVEINIDENDPEIKHIIDLTDPYMLHQLVFTDRGRNFARKFDEVLVEGKIRAECITLI